MVQQYDYHLAAVNTVTFIDQNRRFVSTSGAWAGRRAGVSRVPLLHFGCCQRRCVPVAHTLHAAPHLDDFLIVSAPILPVRPRASPAPALPADDKTIRMWEYGIQAQAKYIAGGLAGAEQAGRQAGRQALGL